MSGSSESFEQIMKPLVVGTLGLAIEVRSREGLGDCFFKPHSGSHLSLPTTATQLRQKAKFFTAAASPTRPDTVPPLPLQTSCPLPYSALVMSVSWLFFAHHIYPLGTFSQHPSSGWNAPPITIPPRSFVGITDSVRKASPAHPI